MMNILKFVGFYMMTGIILIYIIPIALETVIPKLLKRFKSKQSAKIMDDSLPDNIINEATGYTLTDSELDSIKNTVDNMTGARLMLLQIIGILIWPVTVILTYSAIYKSTKDALTDDPNGSN